MLTPPRKKTKSNNSIKGKNHRKFRGRRLALEQLESRQLLAVAPLDFLDRFVAEGSGGLDTSRGLAFGPDVNGDEIEELYVSSGETDAVLRFDGATGLPFPAPGKPGADFISPGSGGLDIPSDLAFGPDGYLYVSSGSANSNKVIRYDASGNNPEVVVSGLTPEPGSPQSPFGLTFDVAGNLYIANLGADEVLKYNSTEGLTTFVEPGSGGLDRPFQAVFGPDGNLYVNSWTPGQDAGKVLRYYPDGTFKDTFATTAGRRMGEGPLWIEFGTDGYLYASVRTTPLSIETSIVRFDASTGARVDRFDLRRDGWSFILKTDPALGVVVYNSTNGHGGFVERFVSSSDPDPTKFYVVDDGRAVNQTYEYGSIGSSVDQYPLASGNNSPRGSAISGFTTLVVDANKNVYVYDPSGNAMGSWMAGGVPGTTQFEGVAVNNVDVWLVDANQDRVYKYSDAAWRVSGSLSAAAIGDGSFALHPTNKNPTDIVTDGNYIWVVDDAKTDKVFKYTMSGGLVGSWPISTSGATRPTGITLDRGNADHLWIVDSGTDLVYQYDHAVTHTIGSLFTSTSFTLAAGNTNPQGIADPPPAASQAPESVAGNSAASVTAMPFTAAAPDDFLSKVFVNAAQGQPTEATQRVELPSHLVDQVMNSWGYPRARLGNSTSVVGQPSAALYFSSGHRARFATDAGDAENGDETLESTLDLMVPGLLADG